jgi:cation:H+ antiporter
MLVWLEFIVCTATILLSGSRLSRYGDIIAEKTHAGRTWIGVVLMASVTSLPELITGVSSVTLFHVPNIAVGDVLGSCMFNLLIVAVLDVGKRREPISSVAQQGQVLTAAFGILLLGATSISILTASSIPALGWIGVNSFVFLLLYLVAMRVVFKYEKRRIAAYISEVREEEHYKEISKSDAYVRFAIYAAFIAAAGIYLPHVADQLAALTHLGQTFVGSTFVALSTSLPEIVVTQAALRLGSVDLAVGNILGSNLFNIAILAVDDALYFKGPLLTHISASHAVTASAAMTMTALMVIALMYRSKKKFFFVSWESLGIFLVYVVSELMLYLER